LHLLNELLEANERAAVSEDPVTFFSEHVFDDRVEELVGYLLEIGLKPSAARLLWSKNHGLNLLVELGLHNYAETLSEQGRNALVRLFGPFPLPLKDKRLDTEVQGDRFLALRGAASAIARFLRDLRQVIEFHIADQPALTFSAAGMGKTDNRPGRRAGSVKSNPVSDAAIATQWKEAHTHGNCATYADFATSKGMNEADVRAAVDRYRGREKRIRTPT